MYINMFELVFSYILLVYYIVCYIFYIMLFVALTVPGRKNSPLGFLVITRFPGHYKVPG